MTMKIPRLRAAAMIWARMSMCYDSQKNMEEGRIRQVLHDFRLKVFFDNNHAAPEIRIILRPLDEAPVHPLPVTPFPMHPSTGYL